jgi:hypothetical protein
MKKYCGGRPEWPRSSGWAANRTGGGTFFVTDRRVGIFTKKLGGHDLIDFAYGLLTSVQYKKGISFGEITLLAAGDSAHFRMIPKAAAEDIAQTIRHSMAAAHDRPGAGPVTEAAPVSVADEIAKLGELKTAGLFTEEEFAAEKARLLGR